MVLVDWYRLVASSLRFVSPILAECRGSLVHLKQLPLGIDSELILHRFEPEYVQICEDTECVSMDLFGSVGSGDRALSDYRVIFHTYVRNHCRI